MSKKMPWNPFPLASLKVMDISSCAKIVLIYLAARSNWKGETCVGVRTIARELKKSTRYVMNGLKELRKKKYMTQSLRDRRDKEADWKVLGQSILSGANTSPEQEAHQVQILPPSDEANAPFQGEACSTEPYRSNKSPNLADGNLTDEKVVSEQASGLSASQDEKGKPTPQGLEPETEDKTNPKIEPVWSEGRADWVGEAETVTELGLCFPAFKLDATPTPKEIRLMQEVIVKCDGYRLLPRTAMDYARKHKQGGLVPRSVKKLHEAICGEDTSSTNGLVAQTKEHSVETCGLCRKELAAAPCSRCHGSTYGKPAIEHGKPFCGECMKLPAYRRESGKRDYLTSSI